MNPLRKSYGEITVTDPDVNDDSGSGISKFAAPSPDGRASKDDRALARVTELRKQIDHYYDVIPRELRDHPDVQARCLDLLWGSEQALREGELVHSRLWLTELEIAMGSAEASRTSFIVIIAIVYAFVLIAIGAVTLDLIDITLPAEELNKELIMGIPKPVWVWSVIGSLTSMLVRAGNLPFRGRTQAMQWLVFRPIVGVVMGLLTYLMLTAGLIVFAGSSSPQTPELIWIIAFVGSFSDTLAVNLLKKLVGGIGSEDVRKDRPTILKDNEN